VSTDFTTAVSTGDPHIVSFDGVAYDFHAAGEFILAREPTATANDTDSLIVQARQEPLAGSDSITQNTAVATVVDNQTVIIDVTDTIPLQIDGSRVELNRSETVAVGNGTITRSGNTLTITYPGADDETTLGDEYLTVDLYSNRVDIELNLDPERDRPVEGVFGPADGNVTNDIGLPNGTALAQPPQAEQLYGVFRQSWRVNNSTTLFAYENDNGPETYYDPTIPAGAVSLSDLDPTERQEAEQRAIDAGLQPGTAAFRNAVLDFAITGDASYLTSAQQQNTSAETNRSVGAPTESIVRVESASLGPGGTADVNLTLERAPQGLAGYNLTVAVSVAETSGVRVTGATAPAVFNTSVTETTVGPENQTAEIRAADIKTAVEANETDISLGEVTVAADETADVSEVAVTVSLSRIDDDTGSPIDIKSQNGTISVTEQPPLAENLNPPTDPDNDGVFEDVNGNGRLDFSDVVALFENLPDARAPFQDFNDNGRIDFDDIVELFKEI
jgi:PKD repeat protein